MKLKSGLILTELLFTMLLFLFVVYSYLMGGFIPDDVLFSFVLFPLSILATVLMLSYYISIRFGKSIFAYGIVLGLAISLIVIAIRLIPPLLTLGLAVYLINRMMLITEVKRLKDISAKLFADHLVSLEIASLIIIMVAKDFQVIFGESRVSPMLFMVILVWFMYNMLYNAKMLLDIFQKWSRSE